MEYNFNPDDSDQPRTGASRDTRVISGTPASAEKTPREGIGDQGSAAGAADRASRLRRSLELEPHSETARSELGYIEDLRRKREAEKKAIPWFLHSFVNPPTDPLTIRLLALVEDLPWIPGPKTVGPENYSRIFDAFMKRGWAGFEEEFDRIVPRDRPDYADVKRDLLREPIFDMKAHRNMADAVLGRKTVDEIFDELAPHREQKPQ